MSPTARVLVLGGGGFLGYHAVAEALRLRCEVTVFSRSGQPPLDGVAVITGDRMADDGLAGLAGQRFDAVFDTFDDTRPGAPAIAATARLLSGAAVGYGYVSGMSVYAPAGPSVPDETAPVRRHGVEPDDDRLQERSLAKLAGEAAVTEHFDGPALFPRVGIMAGPRGRRLNYWPVRLHRAFHGELSRTVVRPGDPDRPVQYSDARDIASWCWRMLLDGRGGTFNTVGPGREDRLVDVLDACAAVAAASVPGARTADLDWLTVADEDLLRRALDSVDEEDRPLWYPEDQIPQRAVDSSAALAAGLRFRPTADTATDILAEALDRDDPSLTDTFGPHEIMITSGIRGAGAGRTGSERPTTARGAS